MGSGLIGRRLQWQREFEGSQVTGLLIEYAQAQRNRIRRNIHILMQTQAAYEQISIAGRLQIVGGFETDVSENGAVIVERGDHEIQNCPPHIAIGS